MTDTLMEGSDLLRASNLLKAAPAWTLFTHRNADGDAVGSASALFSAGVKAGKRVAWVGPDPNLPPSFSFLPHTEDYRTWTGEAPDGLRVFLDCSNLARTAPAESGEGALNIDHHEDNTLFCAVNCVDPASSSTAELLFRVLRAGDWPLSPEVAQGLYVGIWSDSGAFSFSNTTSRTHRLTAELLDLGADPSRLNEQLTQNRTPEGMALWGTALGRIRVFGPEGVFVLSWLSGQDFEATGAEASDTEGLPSYLMQIRGVRLAIFLTDRGEGNVRASFRSREGIFEAGGLARSLGGGGHPRAAGATLDGALELWLTDLPKLLEARYDEWSSASR